MSHRNRNRILLNEGEVVVSTTTGNNGYSGHHSHTLYVTTSWGNVWKMSQGCWIKVGDHNTEEDVHPERYT